MEGVGDFVEGEEAFAGEISDEGIEESLVSLPSPLFVFEFIERTFGFCG